MEEGRSGRYRDCNPRLPTLSLGLSSVKLIVSKLEAEYGRAHDDGSTNCELVKYDPDIEDDFPLSPPRGQVFCRFLLNLAVALSKCIPSVTYGNFAVLALLTGFFAPTMISYLVIYPLCRLVFGTLYPAYASYKAVKTKNLKEYVKWMMYWIVFALFTCTETFTDVFLSWFPFYYEVKIVLVLWLLSPATKGSSILYRKFVHPALCRREQEIDEYIAKAKDQGYHTVLNLGTKGVNYATTVIMQTAIKGGGGLVQQIRKSYSLSDLTECDPREERGNDEADDVLAEPRLIRRAVKSSYNTRRSASESNSRSPLYFPEVDVDVRATRSRGENPDLSHIKSSEDISSGYSSADNSSSLARSSSARARARTAVTAIKRPQAAEDSEVIIEELHDDNLEFSNMPPLVNVPSPLFISHSDPPFIYQYVGDQIRIVQVLGNNPIITNNNQTIDHKAEQTVDNHDKDELDTKFTSKDQENSSVESKLETDFNKDNIFLNEESSDLVDKESHKTKEENIIEKETTTKHKSAEIFSEAKAQENHDDINAESKTFSPEVKDEIITSHRSEEVVSEVKSHENHDDKHSESKSFSPEGKDNVTNLGSTEIQNVLNSDNVVESETFIECEDEEATFDECIMDQILIKDDIVDTISLSTSNYDNESAISDDEASFGTPEDSPKNKRKSTKGRYGKGRAPSPPNTDKFFESCSPDCNISTTSQESLVEMVNKSPNITMNETGTKTSHVNPIAEKKRRHKTRSPGTIPKGNSSGLGKLLQLPSKFAFWHKSDKDDKSKSDSKSVSDDQSRRSSTVEKGIDDFQSCNELNKIDGVTSKEQKFETKLDNYFDGATALESEDISHDILEKSDALQRLIEAKLESHPEYKIVPLHGEIPSTSKSTDV